MSPPGYSIRAMTAADLPAILPIEQAAYSHPWSERIFRDCLEVGYPAWVLADPEGQIGGYALAMVGVDEAHILNITVAARQRGQGLAGQLLAVLCHYAARQALERVFLEVRPSNTAARALYARHGFKQIGRRPGYYPGSPEREDALLLARACQSL